MSTIWSKNIFHIKKYKMNKYKEIKEPHIYDKKGRLVKEPKLLDLVDVMVTKKLNSVSLDPNYKTFSYRHIACFLHGIQGRWQKGNNWREFIA